MLSNAARVLNSNRRSGAATAAGVMPVITICYRSDVAETVHPAISSGGRRWFSLVSE
jgi:hypothetical protein